MDNKDIKDIWIEKLEKQIENQQHILDNSITTIRNIVKDFQKTVRIIILIDAIALVVILGTFFISYFTSDSTSEIKERNSNYNYNENINTNK